MRSAPHIFSEDARLAAVAEYDLRNTDLPIELDGIVQLAAGMFGVPTVLVSIVERDRQFFKAKVGLELCDTARDSSFCAHAIELPREDMLLVPDATLDRRFAANPLVTGDPFIRFYAGVPLRSPLGHAIGTLCIIDHTPRETLNDAEQRMLRMLAALVVDKLEMRRLAVAGAVGQSRFQNIAATSPDGIMCADDAGRITFWNAAAETLFGYSAEEAIGAGIDIIVPDASRLRHDSGLRRVGDGGASRLLGQVIELTARRRDGFEFPVELSLSMWRENGQAAFGAIIRDITERRRNEDNLVRLAHFDGLTGLPNRTIMMQRIHTLVEHDDPAAMLMIDLDGFKDVNDTFGHSQGDLVLRQVAARLQGCVRIPDTVTRLGGDEFAVLLPGTSRPTLKTVADRMIAVLAQPFVIDGQQVYLSASIGIATFPEDGAHAEDLLSAADLAMYQAKLEGRGCRRFFTPALREVAISRRALEGELRRALALGEFELHYQPQVRILDGTLLGAEALLRWRHPTRGLLPPAAFIASIEASLLAAEIGHWVLDTACAAAATLRRERPGLVMGINLFGAQFRAGDLAIDVRETLRRHGLPPRAIELEVTENIILRHDETMLAPLKELHALGVGIAFDDFGTGFASLSLLKRYPLTRLKIDRSFVQEVCEEEADAAIVTAVLYIASRLRIDVIAEGVETEQQGAFLRVGGCAVAQGYLYGRPMPLAELLRYGEDRQAVA